MALSIPGSRVGFYIKRRAGRTFGKRLNFVTPLGHLPEAQSCGNEISNYDNWLSHSKQDIWHILIFFTYLVPL
jgi:hypothetical protein